MFQRQKCFSAKRSHILKHNLSFANGGEYFDSQVGYLVVRWDLSILVGFFLFSTQVLLFVLALPTKARILCLASLSYILIHYVRTCVRLTRQFRVLIHRQNSPAEPVLPVQRPVLLSDSSSSSSVITVCHLSVTTGRREK